MRIKGLSLIVISILCISFSFSVSTYAATTKTRISGSDRYKTAVEISISMWADGSSQIALLATGDNFPDALSAAPLAKKLDAPILLTEKDELTSCTEKELVRLGVKTVYIIGGTGVISLQTENKLKSMNMTVIRLGGQDRYETSIKIAEQLVSPEQLAVATGDDFSDALSIAPFAASHNMPIILMPKDYVPDCVKNYLASVNIKRTFIIGGSEIISDEAAIVFPNTYRIQGDDKYKRNLAVIDNFYSVQEFSTVYIATGNNFPDALSGSVIAARESSPILLVDNVPSQEDIEFINTYKLFILTYKILGGEGAVLPSTLDALIPADKVIDKGAIEGSSYKNDQFKFSLNWPEEWYSYTPSDTSQESNFILFQLCRYKMDSPMINYNLTCAVQEINSNVISNWKDYLKGIAAALKAKNYEVNINNPSQTFGGRNFDVVDAQTAFNGIDIKIRAYVTVIDNYSVLFTAVYTKDEELNELNNVMNTLKFTN